MCWQGCRLLSKFSAHFFPKPSKPLLIRFLTTITVIASRGADLVTPTLAISARHDAQTRMISIVDQKRSPRERGGNVNVVSASSC